MRPAPGRAVLVTLTIALAAVAAGCSEPPRPAPATAAEPATPVAVTVATAAPRTVAQTIEPVGTVRARRQFVVSSRVLAPVVAVHVVEGQRVRAGAVLVELDDRDVKAQVQRAEAAVRAARDGLEEAERALRASARASEAAVAQRELAGATLGRYRQLFEQGAVARQQYEETVARARAAEAEVARLDEMRASLAARSRQAEARIDEATADLANAKVTLGYTTVRATADGIVVAKTVEVGTTAAPAVPLLTMEEERYRLEAIVEESAIRHVRLGQAVHVAIDALGGERAATVTEILPAADAASRTFVVRIELGAVPLLRSGLYGRARMTVGARAALVVPRSALVERGQLENVFVVDGAGVARLRLVRTGARLGDDVEVLSGLADGDRVVVGGPAALVDGTRVEPRG